MRERNVDLENYILEYVGYSDVNPSELVEDICKTYVNTSEAAVSESLWYLIASYKLKLISPSLKVGLYV